MLSDNITAPSTKFSNCLHRIFIGILCETQNFPWVMPLSNLDTPGAKKMIFTSFNFTGCFPGLDSTMGVLLLTEIIGVHAGFVIIDPYSFFVLTEQWNQ